MGVTSSIAKAKGYIRRIKSTPGFRERANLKRDCLSSGDIRMTLENRADEGTRADLDELFGEEKEFVKSIFDHKETLIQTPKMTTVYKPFCYTCESHRMPIESAENDISSYPCSLPCSSSCEMNEKTAPNIMLTNESEVVNKPCGTSIIYKCNNFMKGECGALYNDVSEAPETSLFRNMAQQITSSDSSVFLESSLESVTSCSSSSECGLLKRKTAVGLVSRRRNLRDDDCSHRGGESIEATCKGVGGVFFSSAYNDSIRNKMEPNDGPGSLHESIFLETIPHATDLENIAKPGACEFGGPPINAVIGENQCFCLGQCFHSTLNPVDQGVEVSKDTPYFPRSRDSSNNILDYSLACCRHNEPTAFDEPGVPLHQGILDHEKKCDSNSNDNILQRSLLNANGDGMVSRPAVVAFFGFDGLISAVVSRSVKSRGALLWNDAKEFKNAEHSIGPGRLGLGVKSRSEASPIANTLTDNPVADGFQDKVKFNREYLPSRSMFFSKHFNNFLSFNRSKSIAQSFFEWSRFEYRLPMLMHGSRQQVYCLRNKVNKKYVHFLDQLHKRWGAASLSHKLLWLASLLMIFVRMVAFFRRRNVGIISTRGISHPRICSLTTFRGGRNSSTFGVSIKAGENQKMQERFGSDGFKVSSISQVPRSAGGSFIWSALRTNISNLFPTIKKAKEISFSHALRLVRGDLVSEVIFRPRGCLLLRLKPNIIGIKGNLKDSNSALRNDYSKDISSNADTLLNAVIAPGGEASLYALVESHVKRFSVEKPSALWERIDRVMPLVFLMFWWRFMRKMLKEARAQTGNSDWAQSEGALDGNIVEPTTFDDVFSPVKSEISDIVAFLNHPSQFLRMGARLPRGVLLIGPPGCGKTLLARAVAGEARVPFISITASSLIELYVGRGAGRVRSLFAKARKTAPCVVFIDEIDSLESRENNEDYDGKHCNDYFFSRGSTASSEYVQTLNQLLTEMDGLRCGSGNVVVIAATNRPRALDKALLRSGRFDRIIRMDLPGDKDRISILKHLIGKKRMKFQDEVFENLDCISTVTKGLTGADLENIVNEAAIAAASRNVPAVEETDFIAALNNALNRGI